MFQKVRRMLSKQVLTVPSPGGVVVVWCIILVLLHTVDMATASSTTTKPSISPPVDDIVEAPSYEQHPEHIIMRRDDDDNNDERNDKGYNNKEESSTTTTASVVAVEQTTIHSDNLEGLTDTQKNIILDKIANMVKANQDVKQQQHQEATTTKSISYLEEENKSQQQHLGSGIRKGKIDYLPHSNDRQETQWVSFKDFFAKNQMEQHWLLHEYQQRDKEEELNYNRDDIYMDESDDYDDDEDQDQDQDQDQENYYDYGSSNIPPKGNGGFPTSRYWDRLLMHYTIRFVQISLLVFGIWGDNIWHMLGIRHPPLLYWTAKDFAVQLWVIFFLMVPYMWNLNSNSDLSMLM